MEAINQHLKYYSREWGEVWRRGWLDCYHSIQVLCEWESIFVQGLLQEAFVPSWGLQTLQTLQSSVAPRCSGESGEYERNMAFVGQPGFSTATESGFMSNLCWLMLHFLVCLEAECGMLTFWAFFGFAFAGIQDLILILKAILPFFPLLRSPFVHLVSPRVCEHRFWY